MKKTLLAALQLCTSNNYDLKIISSDQLVSFQKLQFITFKALLLLIVLLYANTFANAQSLTTNPPGNYEVSSSGASVNIGATVTVNTIEDPTPLTAATVSIAGNFDSNNDVLKLNGLTSGTYAGLEISYNPGEGILTVTGSATEAEYQTALQLVTFETTSTSNLPRNITFSLNAAVPFSGNGHYYEFINASVNWNTAVSNASASTYFGLKGYLVTVTSQGESEFVKTKLNGAQGWLGASDATNEGDWKWVTGPENGTLFWKGDSYGSAQNGEYANWNGSEPNNLDNEDYGQFVTTGSWNDLDGTSELGYVVEYGGMSNDPEVQISDNVTVDVITNPTGISATATTICQGSNITLTAQGAQGTVHWYTESCDGTEIGTGNPIAVSPLQNSTYYARNEVDDTYSTACASKTITVNPLLQYRSKQTGLWTDAANWEQYNGTSWVAATSYPGEISNSCGTPSVTIRANQTLTIPPLATISIPNLTIETNGLVEKDPSASLTISQQLIMAEDADGGIKITETIE